MPDASPTTDPGRACERVHPGGPNSYHPRPWRRGSHFGDGPRRRLSADERRIWTARAELEFRAGRLTALHLKVGDALLRRLGADGRCDPSHATLAADAGCSERTVRRALEALKAAGLLSWERRLVRKPWPMGGPGAQRAEQTSNAYELLLPDRPIAPRQERRDPVRRRPDCGGQPDRESPPQYAFSGIPELTEADRRRLEAIQAARKERRTREWHTRRIQRWHMRN